ncbi:hypothetical protein [Methylobrevis albus]|uniref:Uncharacterized protein n=1 Tax=Methylobrevis albus TaxID=2793297 RepID=A0A931HYC3_9HYPH|nr:hypothetical protein [Methylobrevis albus]MBH0236807.1 hypothetical protein [Methylobrevis albus]
MDQALGTLGLLVFLMLFFSTVVEAIMEAIRGFLNQLAGYEMFKKVSLSSEVSIEDALKLSTEFLPQNATAKARITAQIAALEATAKEAIGAVTDKKAIAAQLKTDLVGLMGPDATEEQLLLLAGKTKAAIAKFQAQYDQREQLRIWIIRLISAAVGIVLALLADFNVFQIALDALGAGASTPPDPAAVGEAGQAGNEVSYAALTEFLNRLKGPVGTIITGISAAAGSSYWHDQLDGIRKAKELKANVVKLTN